MNSLRLITFCLSLSILDRSSQAVVLEYTSHQPRSAHRSDILLNFSSRGTPNFFSAALFNFPYLLALLLLAL